MSDSKNRNEISYDGENLSNKEIDVLLNDYKNANQNARYRDRLIYQAFYLSLIFLGTLASVGYKIQINVGIVSTPFFLISVLGFASFFILGVWAYCYKGARDASWGRAKEIENKIGIKEELGNLLMSNKSVNERREEKGGNNHNYYFTGKKGLERWSVSKLTIGFIFLISYFWLYFVYFNITHLHSQYRIIGLFLSMSIILFLLIFTPSIREKLNFI